MLAPAVIGHAQFGRRTLNEITWTDELTRLIPAGNLPQEWRLRLGASGAIGKS
jgi:hypothetical protein